MSNAVDDLFKKTGMRTVGGGQSTTGNYTSTSGSSAGQGSAVDKLFASTGMKVSQVHSRSRESEIANSFANQANQRKDKYGLSTNDERDKLVESLKKYRQDNSGYVTDELSQANYDAGKKQILDKIAAIDKKLGNPEFDYDKGRLSKILASSTTGSAAGIANAAGTLLDFGASLNDRSSDVERAIADSDYSGWVTDEVSLANAKKDYSEGRIKSAGVQNEVRRAATGLENWADTTADKSAQLLEESKAGLGTFGRVAVDVTKGLFDVAGDTLLSAAAPGLGMVRMGTSAFGTAAQEARQNGASTDRQMLMGLKSAGIEVLTEKIGGPFEKAYGKTVLGKSIEKGINKLAKESVWKKLALKGVSNFISEGGEEVLSNVLNVAVDNAIAKIDAGYYTKESNLMRQIGNMRSEIELARANGTITREQETQLAILEGQLNALHTSMANKLEKVDISEALYEGLIGGLTGLVGGTANIRTDVATARAKSAVEAIEHRTEEVKQGKASDGTGIVKNLPVQGNTSQQRVYNLLSAINQDRAKEILNNAKYEQAFEDLTGIDPDTIKGADIDDRAEELVRCVQEAAGAQKAQGGEITSPTPTEATTQPSDALNSNSRENEVVNDVYGADALREIAENPAEPIQTQAGQTRSPRSARDLALWAEGMDAQNAPENRGIDVEADEDATLDDGESGAQLDRVQPFLYGDDAADEDALRDAYRGRGTAAPSGASGVDSLIGTSADRGQAALYASNQFSSPEEAAYYAARDRGEEYSENQNKSRGSRNNQQYEDIRDTAKAQIEDDARAVSRIMDGDGEWASVNPALRADVLNEIVGYGDYTDNRGKFHPGKEYYVRDGRVSVTTKNSENVAVAARQDTESLVEDISKPVEEANANQKRVTKRYTDADDAGFGKRAIRLSAEEERDAARDRARLKERKALAEAKKNGYDPINNKKLGRPASYADVPRFCYKIMSSMDELASFVKGEGKYSQFSGADRFDLCKRMFPDANWTFDGKSNTISVGRGERDIFNPTSSLGGNFVFERGVSDEELQDTNLESSKRHYTESGRFISLSDSSEDTQRLTKDAEFAKVKDDDVKVYKPKGETDNAVSERRDSRVRRADTRGHQENERRVERQNDGGNAGQNQTVVAQGVQRENNQGVRDNASFQNLIAKGRKDSAQSIKENSTRKNVLRILDGIERGNISQDEATKLFKAQFDHSKSNDDKLNIIRAAGGNVLDISTAAPTIKNAVTSAKKKYPRTKVYVVSSDICGPAFCRRDGSVWINQLSVETVAKQRGATVQQVVDHEFQHARFRQLRINGEQAKKWLTGTFSNDEQVLSALDEAYVFHEKVAHKGDSESGLWEEVAVDFLSNNSRVCSDQQLFSKIQSSLNQFMRIHEIASMLATGGKGRVGEDSNYSKSLQDEIDQTLNERDAENAEMQRREDQRKQDEFLELRDADKRTTNAKEWGQKQRQEQRNAELDNTIYDIERAVGGERYSELRSLNHELERATTLDAATKENPGKRKFDKDTFGRAQQAIFAMHDFAMGVSDFKTVAEAYDSLKDRGAEFYDESLAERMKELAETIEQTERNSEKHDGKLPENLADDVVETLTMMSKRIQRGGEFGVKQKDAANNELASVKDQTATGLAKTIEDTAKKFFGVQIRPETMFKVFGQFKNGVFSGLSKKSQSAVRHKINAQQAALEYFAGVTKTKGYEAFATGKTTVENVIPDLEGDTMSTNMALSLLKILETEGAIEHIREHGLVLPNNEKEVYNGLNNNGMGDRDSYAREVKFMTDAVQESYRFADQSNDPKDIAHARASHEEAIKRARDELKAAIMADPVAKAMYEASSSCMRYLGRDINKTSRELWGVNFATQGKNYYPMETRGDSDRLELLNDSFGGLKGARIVQKREGPTGALVVRPFTDTMSRYIERATDYSSFSGLSDELELMSKGSNSVTKKVGNKFGNYFSKWMSEYVDDLNGKPKEGNKFSGLRSNLASAALTLNGGVALKQSPSYWDAAGIIDYGILVKHAPGLLKTAKSFDNNPLLEEVNQRTGMLSNRKLGYNAVEVGEATENGRTLTNKVNKILPNWATNWINKTDYRTTSNLMLACAEQAAHDGYKAGTDEYYNYIADKFEQVLMKSQPIYTKQARAAYLRTGNDLVRTLAMFRTQQTQNFNNLVEAIGEYRNAKGEAKAEASKHLTQVVAGQVTGSIMFGILSAVARAGLHKWDDFEDDEGNFNVGKTASRIGLNILGSAAGTVWFGGELFNYAVDKASNTYAAAYNKAHEEEIEAGELSKKKGTGESYTFGDNALSLIDDIRSASIAFSKNPSPKNMANVVFNISQAFGVPLKNGYNMVNAVTMAALDVDRMLTGGSARNNGSTNDIFKYFSEYDSISDSQKAKLTVDAAARAYKKGHDSKAETMMSTLDYEDESVKKAVAKELNHQYVFGTLTTDQYKKLLKNYLKSENVTATVRGMDNAKKYFDSHTEEEVAADKKAIDANHNGTLTQEELYNFWLDNRSRNSTVEAFWNTNGFTGANALWETYKQNKLKNADYDKLVLDNANNPDFLKAIERAKKLESDNSFYIQTQKGDEAIFDQIVSLRMSDADSEILINKYVSPKNVGNYKVIRNQGLSTKQAVDILKAVDALGEDESKSNGSISQKELVAYYKAHPDMEYVVEALWNAQGYTKKGKPNLWDKTKAK